MDSSAAEQEHSGIHVFVKKGMGPSAKTYHKEVPAMGSKGGNVWFSAVSRYEERTANKMPVYGLDMHKIKANGGMGFGWNRIYIEDIVVDGDYSITYGISTKHDITETDILPSNWFSACDFILERVE